MGLVSIHAPWEGCDVAVVLATRMGMPFQFTHPGKGATGEQSASTLSITSFNSRTLGRVRPKTQHTDSRSLRVSIHAPWEGCDKYKHQQSAIDNMFQFTHPGKGAT